AGSSTVHTLTRNPASCANSTTSAVTVPSKGCNATCPAPTARSIVRAGFDKSKVSCAVSTDGSAARTRSRVGGWNDDTNTAAEPPSERFEGILGKGRGGPAMSDHRGLQESHFGQRNNWLPLFATHVTIPLLPAPPDQISTRGSM